jgi:hypothetical protein
MYIENTANMLNLVKITDLIATRITSKLSGSMIYSASSRVSFDS